MKKLKEEKGITLVALIITIVVLLILAGVAIGTLDQSNIIGKAQSAAKGYDEEKNKENGILSDYEVLLNQYGNGNSSAGNNGGTTNNPGGENNNGGKQEETEQPEVTPPAPVYYSKTLNTNMSDYADALVVNNENNRSLLFGSIITYVSDSSKLEVRLSSGTTFENFSVIYVRYTDAQGAVSTYAICNPEDPWTLEEHKGSSAAYNYVPVGSWTQPSGGTYTNNSGTADIYETITQIPIFEGEWQIDEANTTAEGKQYLSNVLIDVTN